MDAELELDYAQLRRSGEGIAEAHERAQAEALAFLEELMSHGRPWGTNNAVSEAIGMCYGSAHEVIKSCVQSNLDEYGVYSGGLRTTVATYQMSDRLAGEQFDDLLA